MYKYILVFVSALFIIAEYLKQPKCPGIEYLDLSMKYPYMESVKPLKVIQKIWLGKMFTILSTKADYNIVCTLAFASIFILKLG